MARCLGSCGLLFVGSKVSNIGFFFFFKVKILKYNKYIKKKEIKHRCECIKVRSTILILKKENPVFFPPLTSKKHETTIGTVGVLEISCF